MFRSCSSTARNDIKEILIKQQKQIQALIEKVDTLTKEVHKIKKSADSTGWEARLIPSSNDEELKRQLSKTIVSILFDN